MRKLKRKSTKLIMKRNKYIINLSNLGYSNATIGRTFKLSRERIRQILSSSLLIRCTNCNKIMESIHHHEDLDYKCSCGTVHIMLGGLKPNKYLTYRDNPNHRGII